MDLETWMASLIDYYQNLDSNIQYFSIRLWINMQEIIYKISIVRKTL